MSLVLTGVREKVLYPNAEWIWSPLKIFRPFLHQDLSLPKFQEKSSHNFPSNPTDMQTERLTGLTCFAILWLSFSNCYSICLLGSKCQMLKTLHCHTALYMCSICVCASLWHQCIKVSNITKQTSVVMCFFNSNCQLFHVRQKLKI